MQRAARAASPPPFALHAAGSGGGGHHCIAIVQPPRTQPRRRHWQGRNGSPSKCRAHQHLPFHFLPPSSGWIVNQSASDSLFIWM